jgi:hypothetical protein
MNVKKIPYNPERESDPDFKFQPYIHDYRLGFNHKVHRQALASVSWVDLINARHRLYEVLSLKLKGLDSVREKIRNEDFTY